jgi:hypothetical protein
MSSVQSGISLAAMVQMLHQNGFSFTDSTVALAAEYAGVSAPDLAAVLQTVWQPAPQSTDFTTALVAAGYPQESVQQTVAGLFPQPTYRQAGPLPANNRGMPFDDTADAQKLNQPITAVNIRSGEIIDAVQALYGAAKTALPQHGGQGGGVSSIVFDPGETLIRVSGFYGSWYGAIYILQVTLATQTKSYGPYGSMGGSSNPIPFSFDPQPGEQISAFSGSIVSGLQADQSISPFLTMIGVTFRKG